MSYNHTLDPIQKALQINLNPQFYGSIAEIGAGQEVARYFFRAGGAAGTIAKTISAYDMVFSDSIYGKGKSTRYVSEDRVHRMLDEEYQKVERRLKGARGKDTGFFGFANTVAAKSFRGNRECHGWMGIKFQHKPGAEPSVATIHVRMLDKENIQQQEALGIIGVNLMYASFFHADDPNVFIATLMEHLSIARIEIDMIRVSGPAFKGVDSRVLSLELVKRKYCQAVLFDCDGSVLQAADALYKQNLVVLRGSFRPPTHVNMDMLEQGLAQFKEDLPVSEHSNITVLPDISMNKLRERGEVDTADFLARVDILSCLNQKVLISNFENFHELNSYLEKYANKEIAFVLGVYNLEEVFNEARYEDFPYGILGAVGALIGHRTRLYVYPGQCSDEQECELITIENANIDQKFTFLLMYLMENGYMKNLEKFNPNYFNIWSRTVLAMIEKGESGWEKMVPDVVAKLVKKKKLFEYKTK